MKKLTPYQVIANLGGVKVEDVNEWAYEVGLTFLDMKAEPEVVRHELERSKMFWNWWTCQFEKLTLKFVSGCDWRGLTNEATWAWFKRFSMKHKTSNWGESSYARLLDEFILPEYRKKKRKQQQELERAGLEIVNH